ncbi:hypothetical protein [Chitinophaga pinensis]|uniref:Uncharacterized protein n=1 Tax=Chitinophaga pinensis (strain ATCC 43595 / DSM 2588 / LMG 13176 / NBRC 15968 / NCIMB 11800 / UQM 2034) TaxID=485918 RepID=A0A979G5S7_CHIPD|nr:hypothetical protein [Chitinophaga pinensis]ACU61241.1 hypothetical protein Cpin_3779 [Chitinophaga pinensis DSM 2588]
MKRTCLFMVMLFSSYAALACPACEKQQPKILRGITHGTGPESQWDYVIIVVTVVFVLITLFLSVKWLIRPDESMQGHIKTSIINH